MNFSRIFIAAVDVLLIGLDVIWLQPFGLFEVHLGFGAPSLSIIMLCKIQHAFVIIVAFSGKLTFYFLEH